MRDAAVPKAQQLRKRRRSVRAELARPGTYESEKTIRDYQRKNGLEVSPEAKSGERADQLFIDRGFTEEQIDKLKKFTPYGPSGYLLGPDGNGGVEVEHARRRLEQIDAGLITPEQVRDHAIEMEIRGDMKISDGELTQLKARGPLSRFQSYSVTDLRAVETELATLRKNARP